MHDAHLEGRYPTSLSVAAGVLDGFAVWRELVKNGGGMSWLIGYSRSALRGAADTAITMAPQRTRSE